MQEQQQPPRQDISFHAQWNERFDFNQWEQALPGFETADLSNIMHLNEQSFASELLEPAFSTSATQRHLLAINDAPIRTPHNRAPETQISRASSNEAAHSKSSSTDFHRTRPLHIHIALAEGPHNAARPIPPSSDRPNRCPYESCNSSFRYPKDLERHKLTHSGERSFKCPVCYCEYYERGFAGKMLWRDM